MRLQPGQQACFLAESTKKHVFCQDNLQSNPKPGLQGLWVQKLSFIQSLLQEVDKRIDLTKIHHFIVQLNNSFGYLQAHRDAGKKYTIKKSLPPWRICAIWGNFCVGESLIGESFIGVHYTVWQPTTRPCSAVQCTSKFTSTLNCQVYITLAPPAVMW